MKGKTAHAIPGEHTSERKLIPGKVELDECTRADDFELRPRDKVRPAGRSADQDPVAENTTRLVAGILYIAA